MTDTCIRDEGGYCELALLGFHRCMEGFVRGEPWPETGWCVETDRLEKRQVLNRICNRGDDVVVIKDMQP